MLTWFLIQEYLTILPLEVTMGDHYHIFWNEELNGTNEGWYLRKGQHDG